MLDNDIQVSDPKQGSADFSAAHYAKRVWRSNSLTSSQGKWAFPVNENLAGSA